MKNPEETRAKRHRKRKKKLLACLLFLFFVGVAGAAIYNLMQIQSEVGVNVVAFVCGDSSLMSAYF